MFRNLTMFRLPQLSLFGLTGGLAECKLRPVGPMELSTRGFVSPYGRDSDLLAGELPGMSAHWLAVGGEDRLLPASVVDALLAEKLDDYERKSGYRPGGRTRKRVKDELITELLPRAFVKPSRVDAIVDNDLGVLFVDTASRKAGEMVASEIRRALGSFPALPLNAEVAPRSVMTAWVAGEALPEGLTLGEEVELRDAIDAGAIVKAARFELADSEEIDRHLAAGRQVTRLALTLDDRVSFVLGEDLSVRKLRFLDTALDSLENTEREDQRAELDARFALTVGEARRVFEVIERAFRISRPDGAPADER